MKLATLKNGKRDGQLCVVSKDLSKAVFVPNISLTLQSALDDWKITSSQLQEIYVSLNHGQVQDAFAFDEKQALSPLPRAYQWADGSAYVNHVELVRKARNAEMPKEFWTDPLMYQGGSDSFLAPYQDIEHSSEEHGVDFEAEICVITDDVPMGVSVENAGRYIRLIMLVNDVSLRNLIPNELGKGFGFFNSKPSSAFSPVAITPDELGDAWNDYKVHLPLLTSLNHQSFGYPNAGVDMTFNFAKLIAHAAQTRPLSSGTIIGSGTVSNVDRSVGSCCIAERRMLEIIETGSAKTSFMRFGDHIEIKMLDSQNQNIFGSISQTLREYKGAK